MSALGSPSPLFLASAAADAAAAGAIKSVRFNSADSAYLNRTPSSAGNRKTFTYSGWIKRCSAGTYQTFFSAFVDSNNFHHLRFRSDETLETRLKVSGSNSIRLTTTQKFRDFSAWYHVVFACDTTQATAADRAKLYVNGTQITNFSTETYPSLNDTSFLSNTTAHYIGRRGDDNYYHNGYMADVYFIDGQALDPTSFGAFDDNGVWQAAAYSGTFGTNGFHLFDFANESGIGNDSSGNDNDWTVNNITLNAANYANATTTASSGEVPNGGTPYWIDIVPTNADLDYDSGSTGMQRVHDGSTTTEVYWVGDQYSSGNVTRARFDLRDYSSISTLRVYGGFSGYTAYNYQLLDSSKSAISGTSGSFGAIGWHSLTISGSPRYLEISCTSGSNRRFRLYAIEVNGTVLTSSDPSNIDVLRDVPTNGDSSDDTGAGGEVSGNYATLNPNITGTYISSRTTLSNGNLQFVNTQYSTLPSTIAMSSGKWYCEGTLDALASASNQVWAGLIRTDAPNNAYEYFQGNNPTRGVHFWGDNTGLNRAQSYGASYATVGTVIGIAFDADAGSCTWYINGSSQGASTYNIVQGEEYFFSFGAYTNGAWTVNFGQRPFAYSAPSGYKALCTTNLSTPTIADSSTAFDIALYTGNGSSQTISGLNHSPDLVWLKNRSHADNHALVDTVRGVTKWLLPNDRTNELTYAQSLTAFTSDGFTVGSDDNFNRNTSSFVAWAWDGGTSTGNNTDGSITSSVRASTTNGFSIVKYTGTGANATVGHGLNAAPDCIIFKDINRDNEPWFVYHSSLGNQANLFLNTTASKTTGQSDFMNNTDPTSSVFSLGNATGKQNRSGSNFLALCWSAVEGFSKFGTFQGNGNADGPFIHLGFKPALIWVKGHDFASNWFIHDYKRPGHNVNTGPLRIAPEVELTVATYNMDFLSNGFKMRTSSGDSNQNAKNFAYFAWAENPFQANGGLAR